MIHWLINFINFNHLSISKHKFNCNFQEDDFYFAACLHSMFKLKWLSDKSKKNEFLKKLKMISTAAVGVPESAVPETKNADKGFFGFMNEENNNESNFIDRYLGFNFGHVRDLKNEPFFRKSFITYNTVLPNSALVERLWVFSIGGQIF